MSLKFYLLLLVSTALIKTSLTSESPKESLCDNPIINSADRMVNGTVRLYRDNHYWELIGLPDRQGMLSGPFKIWYKNFGTIHRNSSIMSCLICNRKGYIFKFEGKKWWAWQTSGEPWKGDQAGEEFKYLPNGVSFFDTVFHNGRAEEPLMIALIGDKVFYYSTKGYFISPAPNYDTNGYPGGKFGEKFPAGVNASFSWPVLSPKDGYFVYLFKGDKYCFRKEKAENGKECVEWRQSRELFGCDMSAVTTVKEGQTESEEQSATVEISADRTELSQTTKETQGSDSSDSSEPEISSILASDLIKSTENKAEVTSLVVNENEVSIPEKSKLSEESSPSPLNQMVLEETIPPKVIDPQESKGQTTTSLPLATIVAGMATTTAGVDAQKELSQFLAFASITFIIYFKLF